MKNSVSVLLKVGAIILLLGLILYIVGMSCAGVAVKWWMTGSIGSVLIGMFLLAQGADMQTTSLYKSKIKTIEKSTTNGQKIMRASHDAELESVRAAHQEELAVLRTEHEKEMDVLRTQRDALQTAVNQLQNLDKQWEYIKSLSDDFHSVL